MSVTQRKVYEYSREKVRDQLLDVFRKRRGEATAADLVAATGLPTTQVQAEVKAVSDEYGARLRVTESGELLYSFPGGMKSRYHGAGPTMARVWKGFRRGAARVLSFLFKIWIVVMLVGYFLLFMAIALLALFASIAGRTSSDSKDSRSGRGGSFSGFGLLEAIMRIWFYSELVKDPYDRERSRQRREAKRGERGDRRPLHRAVFSFVFGEGDTEAAWAEAERKAVISFVQANRGIITLPEFMGITGLSPAEAELAINRYLYEYEGSPEVTEGGTIYYSFPELMRRKDLGDRSAGASTPIRRLEVFSGNPKASNAWYCVFNGVNLLFGSYFLLEAARLGDGFLGSIAAGIPGYTGIDYVYVFLLRLVYAFTGIGSLALPVAVGLGMVPLAFSVLFYLIPAVRAARLAARNERVKLGNLRRAAVRSILSSPDSFRPDAIPALDEASKPRDGKAPAKVVDEIAAWSGADIAQDGSYVFKELARQKSDAVKARAAVDMTGFKLGDAVFDSGS